MSFCSVVSIPLWFTVFPCTPCPKKIVPFFLFFDVEYIYSFVWWGVCKQSRYVTALPSRHKMADMCYYGNVMTTTRWWVCVTILHLQQYSHRLKFLYFFTMTDHSLRATSGLCTSDDGIPVTPAGRGTAEVQCHRCSSLLNVESVIFWHMCERAD